MYSTDYSSLCDEEVRPCVKKFLETYNNPEIRKVYQDLVELTKKNCEKLLEDIKGKDNVTGIKGVVQGRTKKYKSLEKKLGDLEKVDNEDPEEYRWWKKRVAELKTKHGNDLEEYDRLAVLESDLKECDSLKKEMNYLGNDDNWLEYGWLEERLTKLKSKHGNDPEDYDSSKEKLALLEEKLGNLPKEYELGKKKLTELEKGPNEAPNFRASVSNLEDIYKHAEMGDLAGVRIGLYFPDDVVRVIKEIKERFETEWLFGTVTGGRDTTKRRNVDIDKHLDGPLLDGNNDHWEHYGYKSWQLVVQPLPEHLKLLEVRLNSLGVDPKSLRVEIQVGTVVRQAWDEVNHNIIYKRDAHIPITPTIRRIIDAINGLAITTDIMLRELERSLVQDAWVRDTICFRNINEAVDWFKSTYLPQEDRLRWYYRPESIEGLSIKLHHSKYRIRRPCPLALKMVIEEKGLLEAKKGTGGEICEFLAKALGTAKEDRRYDSEQWDAAPGMSKEQWTKKWSEGLWA
jgi:ppGpp synthetase/RelA/SpoT-type nucleotidyltranferase